VSEPTGQRLLAEHEAFERALAWAEESGEYQDPPEYEWLVRRCGEPRWYKPVGSDRRAGLHPMLMR